MIFKTCTWAVLNFCCQKFSLLPREKYLICIWKDLFVRLMHLKLASHRLALKSDTRVLFMKNRGKRLVHICMLYALWIREWKNFLSYYTTCFYQRDTARYLCSFFDPVVEVVPFQFYVSNSFQKILFFMREMVTCQYIFLMTKHHQSQYDLKAWVLCMWKQGLLTCKKKPSGAVSQNCNHYATAINQMDKNFPLAS